MSELAGTSKKILIQPPHFLGNAAESQREKASECLWREACPAESSTLSNTSPPSLSPASRPPGPTLHPVQPQSPGSRWQSPPPGGGGTGVATGQGGKSPSRGLAHVGLATVPRLPSKQVLSRERSCTHTENSRPLSPATNLPQPRKTQSSSKHLTQGDFLSLTLLPVPSLSRQSRNHVFWKERLGTEFCLPQAHILPVTRQSLNPSVSLRCVDKRGTRGPGGGRDASWRLARAGGGSQEQPWLMEKPPACWGPKARCLLPPRSPIHCKFLPSSSGDLSDFSRC